MSVTVHRGDVVEGNKSVSPKENAEAAHDSEGEREFTSNGKVAEPGHAGDPFL